LTRGEIGQGRRTGAGSARWCGVYTGGNVYTEYRKSTMNNTETRVMNSLRASAAAFPLTAASADYRRRSRASGRDIASSILRLSWAFRRTELRKKEEEEKEREREREREREKPMKFGESIVILRSRRRSAVTLIDRRSSRLWIKDSADSGISGGRFNISTGSGNEDRCRREMHPSARNRRAASK